MRPPAIPPLLAAVWLAACEPPPPPVPAPSAPAGVEHGGAAGTPAPASPAGVGGATEPPAPPKFPVTAILVSATAVEPAARLPLDPASETVVDPGASFELVLSARVSDARLVLLDAQEAQLPAEGSVEVGRRTTLTVSPASPLVPGSRYRLRLEGAVGRELHDAGGRAFEPLSLPVLAAGTPPPPDPPARKKRRRR